MRQFVLWLLLIILITNAYGQSKNELTAGFFPEAALTYALGESWQLMGKIESQHFAYQNTLAKAEQVGYQHYRTDLQLFMLRKLNPRWKVAAGYQRRLSGGNRPDHHRGIQQVSYKQPTLHMLIGHRLRSDQTFTPNSANDYRIRYRFSTEIPLQGPTIDYGETYLLFSDEIILATAAGSIELENRLVGAFGWEAKNAKYQVGLDYRTDDYLSNYLHHQLWVKFGAYISI